MNEMKRGGYPPQVLKGNIMPLPAVAVAGAKVVGSAVAQKVVEKGVDKVMGGGDDKKPEAPGNDDKMKQPAV